MAFTPRRLMRGASAAREKDPYFNYVTMLLHGDGTNGAQNNTFLDSSTNNFTITRNGNTTQGSFSPYGSNWSNSFNGTNSYLTLSSNASMSFGTGNFTIEGWFFTGDKSISGGANRMIVGNSGNSYTMQLYIDSSGFLTFGNTGSTFIQGSTDLANNTWHHFAISRSGTSTNQIAMWVDGTRVAQGTNSQNYTSGTIYIGAFGASDGFWNGYISNLRIVKGSAVYDPANSTITVPTTPLTAITNTALLTCQTNRFFDGSANAYTVTATGSPSVQRFNPFGTSTAYSTSVIGGSGYFDGSGDYLNTTSGTSLGSGNWTVECWVYFVTAPAADGGHILCSYDYYTSGFNGNAVFRCGTSYLYRSFNGQTQQGEISGSFTWKTNTWYHVAWSRVSNVITCYQNGVSIGSTTDSTTLADFANGAVMGVLRANGSLSEYQNYYIGGLKVTPATALYTGTFTPPTSPFTISSGTSLLLTNTNAGILDNAMQQDLETVGNVQISTGVKKYGTGSLAFDGTGDYLTAARSQQFAYGTGNFTIEFWAYPTSFSGYKTFYSGYLLASSAAGFELGIDGSGFLYVYSNNGFAISASSSALSLNAWNHVAMVRNGSTITVYIDGVSKGTWSLTSQNFTDNYLVIGQTNTGPSQFFTGYLDDFRITKGYARYTANIAAPTLAFSDTGPA